MLHIALAKGRIAKTVMKRLAEGASIFLIIRMRAASSFSPMMRSVSA